MTISLAATSSGIQIGPPQLVSKSAAYTIDIADQLILCDGSSGGFTVTLPSVTEKVQDLYVIKATSVAGGHIVVDGNGSETLDGALTKTLSTQYAAIVLAPDGSNWHIISQLGTVS